MSSRIISWRQVGGLEGDNKGRVMDEITCVKETDFHLGIEDTRVRNTSDS